MFFPYDPPKGFNKYLIRGKDIYILFSEGGFNLGTATAFFVQVWHPVLVDPGTAPAFFVIKFLHQRDIHFSLVHVHSNMRYKIKMFSGIYFFINLDVPIASLHN